MKFPKAFREINLKNASLLKRGKVRDIFDLGDFLLMAASDRVSAFDVVLPNAIPYKGKVLNSISSFWFKKTNDVIPNHFVTEDVGAFPFDIPLPPGLRQGERLHEPVPRSIQANHRRRAQAEREA